MSKKGCPVVIRGKKYPSQAAAGRALGIPASAIGIALDRGTIDNAGLGRNYKRLHPIILNGVFYESITEACEGLEGIKPESIRRDISSALKKGNRTVIHKGLEIISLKGIAISGRHPNDCPVEIRGKLYRSIKNAAESLGVYKSTVSDALNRGRLEYVGLGTNATRRRKVTVNGTEYPSINEACRAVGIKCHQDVYIAIKREKKSGAQGHTKFNVNGFIFELEIN